MIDVWGVKLAIFLQVGSGECLFASLLERTKCVGIFKSAAHKQIVWARLFDLVKNARLATITLPEKPAEITQWEARRGSGPPPPPASGAAAGSQGAPPLPLPAQGNTNTFHAFGALQLNAA